MWDFCFIPKAVNCREVNAFLDCMNLKIKVEILLQENKYNLHMQFDNRVCCNACVPGRWIRPLQ